MSVTLASAGPAALASHRGPRRSHLPRQAPMSRARRARSDSAHRGAAARSAMSPRSPPTAGRACCPHEAHRQEGARTVPAADRAPRAKSRSSETGCESSLPGVFARTKIDTPAWRPIRRTMSSWPGWSSLCAPHCNCGTRWRRTTTSVAVLASAFPARTRIGTPAQRQFSISKRRATNVSVSESERTPSISL